ncbi:MAG: SelB C-terminal domain-containing protein [Armatimonadetes bacterium]|nr:SelB C-terminal domain-containing protein [Armatimonadota bacterium]
MPFDVVDEAEKWPEGVMTSDLERAAGRDVSFDLERAKTEESVVSLAGLWLTPAALHRCRQRLYETLASLHQTNPEVAGWPPDAVAAEAGLRWKAKPAQRAFDRMSSDNEVRCFDGLVALKGFRPHLTDRQEALLERVRQALQTHGLDVPGHAAVAEELGVPRQAVTEIARIGYHAGDLRLFGDTHVPALMVETVISDTREHFGNREFSVGEWRDALATSRRVAVQWLEHMDQWGLTVKSGDFRRLYE